MCKRSGTEHIGGESTQIPHILKKTFEEPLRDCGTLGLVLPRMCDRSIVGTIDFIAPEIYDVTWLAILVDMCVFANTKSFANV